MPALQNRLPNTSAMIDFDEPPQTTQPSRPQEQLKLHWQILAVACGVWLLAFLLHEVEGGRIALRGLPHLPLPQTCASRALLGLRCPGCGLTRSIIHLAEGDVHASWQNHRLGGLLALALALQIPYRLYALRWPVRPLLSPLSKTLIACALCAVLIANWLVDVAGGRLSSP
jgi:Protein of unknown function (DUF2752)